jgi:hypothetical protein
MGLYDYANGDPVNGLDPNGRVATGFVGGLVLGSFYQPQNANQALGAGIGQITSYAIPGYDEFAISRDVVAGAYNSAGAVENIAENGLNVENGMALAGDLVSTLPGGGEENALAHGLEDEVGTEANTFSQTDQGAIDTFENEGGAVTPEPAAEGAQPLALGLKDAGLDAFAEARGATTATGEDWQATVLEKLNDPNTTVHFNLDGVDVWPGVQRAASGQGGPTDWELLQIRQNPQSWDTLQFWKSGQPAPNPFQ